MLRIYFFIFLIFSITKLSAQVGDQDYRLFVLKQNVVDSEYKFIDKKDSTEINLKYLGKMTTNKGDTFKVMTSVWIWGMSHRATNRILIFDARNKYIGNYNLTDVQDLPNKIIDNKLTFYNLNNDCDPKLVTKISFENGLRREFFRKCREGAIDSLTGTYNASGALFHFESN